ncbi:MAG TPA: MFS transporter [Bacteroidales bacterium]|nr:MFS transporter [Bacteroidales bacterium]
MVKSSTKVLIVLFAGVLMGALDIAVIGPAIPSIQDGLSISDRNIPWIFDIYVLFSLISAPLMGKLSDIYGRRLIYTMDLLIFAIGSVVVMASPDFATILAGRAIQGFGAGGIFPVAAAVIGDTIPRQKQGSALGLIGAVFGLAFIIGPAVGGALLLLGWRWIFAVNLPFAAVLVYFALRILPSDKQAGKVKFDWPGMILLIILLASFSYGINRIDASSFLQSITSLNVWPFIFLSLLIIPVFYRVQKKSPNPAIHLNLLRSRQLLFTYFIAFGAGLGELATIYFPSLAKAAFGVTESTASFMMIPLVFALFIAAPVAGRIIDKAGSKLVILIGIVLLITGLFVLALLKVNHVVFYGAGVLIGVGLAFLLGAPLRYIMNNETGQGERAAGQSLLTIFTSTGQLFSAALMGALVASKGGGIPGFDFAFLVLAFVSALLLVPALGLKNKQQEAATARKNNA